MTWRSPKLLAAVRELPCQSCGAQDGTVCAAHANKDKGMGIKSSDATVSALCFKCHAMLDQSGTMTKQVRREFEEKMNLKTLRALLERELVRVA